MSYSINISLSHGNLLKVYLIKNPAFERDFFNRNLKAPIAKKQLFKLNGTVGVDCNF